MGKLIVHGNQTVNILFHNIETFCYTWCIEFDI